MNDPHPIVDELGGGTADGPPPILLPYQQRWVEDPAEVKIAEKGRRIGLTWAEASDNVVTAALARGAGGENVYYIGYNREMAAEYIDACGVWAKAFGRAASAAEETVFEDQDPVTGETRKIQAFRIAFASGNRITALSSRPRSLRGIQGVVIIDEAAFHDDLDGLLKAAIAMLIWGGKVRIISTHNGEDNPFADMIEQCRAGRLPYSVHRIDFDQALSDGLYRRICEVLDREWSPEAESDWRAKIVAFYRPNEDEELFVIPARGGGVYLPGALVLSCMVDDIPVIRWAVPDRFAELDDATREAEADAWCEAELRPHLDRLDRNLPSYFGEDFGRSGDLTVIWPLQIRPDLVRATPFVVELRNVPFRQQEQILYFIVDNLPRFTYGALDARGNGQYLAERAMQEYGSSLIDCVMLSTGWYRENMPQYKAAFEDAMIIVPKDRDILDDHRQVIMEKGIAKVPEGARTRTAGGDQRHGDSAIAGALAYYASNADTIGYGYQSARPSRGGIEDARFDDDDDDFDHGGGRGVAAIQGAW